VAIKVMSNMDIAESRRPQDGRIGENYVSGKDLEVALDMRVSTLPCVGGEKAVIRLLPQENPFSGLQDLGFSETTLNIYKSYNLFYRKKNGTNWFSNNNINIRAFYNDSYEVYGADWTEHFLEKFKSKRGYELGEHLNIFENKTTFTEEEKQIYSDYQLTISELLLEEFTQPYAAFAKKYGKLSRNESHGSPGNVLDLYAANSIPETEFFGSKPFDIPLYRQDPEYSEKQFGKPNKMVLKLASSPANIFGEKLVSSETATWLGNHFKVSLSQVKPAIAAAFLVAVRCESLK
jgi:hypothetical protein